jgi:hypothetical protein
VLVVGRGGVDNMGGFVGLLRKSNNAGGSGVVVVVVVVEVVVVVVVEVVLLVVSAVESKLLTVVLVDGLLGFLVRYTPDGFTWVGLCGRFPIREPERGFFVFNKVTGKHKKNLGWLVGCLVLWQRLRKRT